MCFSACFDGCGTSRNVMGDCDGYGMFSYSLAPSQSFAKMTGHGTMWCDEWHVHISLMLDAVDCAYLSGFGWLWYF